MTNVTYSFGLTS